MDTSFNKGGDRKEKMVHKREEKLLLKARKTKFRE